jgi:hypothetical protein
MLSCSRLIGGAGQLLVRVGVAPQAPAAAVIGLGQQHPGAVLETLGAGRGRDDLGELRDDGANILT